jgi:diacylglycerol kinase (ATP)
MSGERRPAAILLNRGAATARSARVREAVELTRRALDADLLIADTRDAAELTGWMAERVAGYRMVVVAGGDGSLSIAYNVLADRSPDAILGYIPAGFGNATRHLLRLPRDPRGLVALIINGEPRPVDLVEADGRLAFFAGAGWDALVAGRYAETGARRLIGWAAAIARSVPDLVRRQRVTVQADGVVVHEGPMELLIVSTTPWYGRGLLVNPGARPTAGRITLRVYPGPFGPFVLDALRWAARRTPSPPAIHATEVVARADDAPLLVQADGDVIGERPEWRFRLRPAAVRIIGRW